MVSIQYLKQKITGKKEVAEELPSVQNRATGLGVFTTPPSPTGQDNASERSGARSPSLESVRTVDLEKSNAAIEHAAATAATDGKPTSPALGKPTWRTLWLPRHRFAAVICSLLTVLAVVTVIVLAVELNKMPSMDNTTATQSAPVDPLTQSGVTIESSDPQDQPTHAATASGFKPDSGVGTTDQNVSTQTSHTAADSAPLGYIRMKTRSLF